MQGKDVLKKSPLFSEFEDSELLELLRASKKRDYQKGADIIYEGQQGDGLYLIMEGKVKIVLTDEDGNEIILNTLGKGEFFGEMSLFDRRPRSATVVAIEDCKMLVISPAALLRQIEKSPSMAVKLLREMSLRLRGTDEKVSTLAFLDVTGRVAKILLQIIKERGTKQGKKVFIAPRPSNTEIAHMAGTSRETVSRILNNFQRRGLITLTRKDIIIHEELDL